MGILLVGTLKCVVPYDGRYDAFYFVDMQDAFQRQQPGIPVHVDRREPGRLPGRDGRPAPRRVPAAGLYHLGLDAWSFDIAPGRLMPTRSIISARIRGRPSCWKTTAPCIPPPATRGCSAASYSTRAKSLRRARPHRNALDGRGSSAAAPIFRATICAYACRRRRACGTTDPAIRCCTSSGTPSTISPTAISSGPMRPMARQHPPRRLRHERQRVGFVYRGLCHLLRGHRARITGAIPIRAAFRLSN